MNEVPSTPLSEETEQVFQVALSLVPAAKAFGRKLQLDPEAAHDAVMEAAERVVRSAGISNRAVAERIKNLPAYLFTVARHLMLDEIKRQREEMSIDNPDNEALLDRHRFENATNIYYGILQSEIVERMNPKARAIIGYRTKGYSYKEIAEEFRKRGFRATAGSLRSELSKAYAEITQELEKPG